jgi:hypothetical protein
LFQDQLYFKCQNKFCVYQKVKEINITTKELEEGMGKCLVDPKATKTCLSTVTKKRKIYI